MSTTPGSAWRRSMTSWRGRTAPPRCAPRRRRCSGKFNEVFWDEAGGFYAFMLDGEKRPVLVRRVQSRPLPLFRHRSARARRARRRPAAGARHELRLGHPHPVGAASGVQSVCVSTRLRLAARQRHHRRGLQALRLRRGGRADRPRHLRRGEPLRAATRCPSCMPASSATAPTSRCSIRGANVPQAWAAGSAFMLLQAMLGIEPDAPRGVLHVDPVLPRLAAGRDAVRVAPRRAGFRHQLPARRCRDARRGAARRSRPRCTSAP